MVPVTVPTAQPCMTYNLPPAGAMTVGDSHGLWATASCLCWRTSAYTGGHTPGQSAACVVIGIHWTFDTEL